MKSREIMLGGEKKKGRENKQKRVRGQKGRINAVYTTGNYEIERILDNGEKNKTKLMRNYMYTDLDVLSYGGQ